MNFGSVSCWIGGFYGFINGDVITKVNDVLIDDVSTLQKEIYSYNLNDVVTIEYNRNNSFNTVDIVLNK